MATVHEAKKVRSELALALDAAADFLGRHPEHAQLAGQAKMLSVRLEGMAVAGKEVDPVQPGDLALITEATTVGTQILEQTEAGRKVPRVRGYIEGAQRFVS